MSPHVVLYQLWVRPAAGQAWIKPRNSCAGIGWVKPGKTSRQTIGVLPAGGQLGYVLAFSGAANTRCKARVAVIQGGVVCADGSWFEEKKVNDNGHAVAEAEVTLA